MSNDDFSARVFEKQDVAGFVSALKYDKAGLVSVIVQDALSGAVLMLAHADEQAVKATLETGVMHYYSRSRKKMWRKGEESGNEQVLDSLYIDCDGDALLAQVRQVKAACHLGYRSCFSNQVDRSGRVINIGRRVDDPGKMYGKRKK